MTTIPPPKNQNNNLRTLFSFAAARVLIGFTLLAAAGTAAAQTYDAAEQLYRRGYPTDVDLEWAVSDYNSAHNLDSIAKNYPKLDIAEILPAISRAITETPKKDKRKLAKLAVLKQLVTNGRLPRGSRLTYQYEGKNTRSPYETQWGKLFDKFSIVLFSGMDENPPGEGEWNEKAFIFGVMIRFHKRNDPAWEEMLKEVAENMKHKKEH